MNEDNNYKPKSEEDAIIEKILEHLGRFCPKCGEPRSAKNIKITGRVGSSLVVHIQCDKCGSQSLLNIIPNIGLSMLEGLITDVRGEEFPRFARSRRVNKDDILDIYVLMEKVKDAEELISKLSSAKKEVKNENLKPLRYPPFSDATELIGLED